MTPEHLNFISFAIDDFVKSTGTTPRWMLANPSFHDIFSPHADVIGGMKIVIEKLVQSWTIVLVGENGVGKMYPIPGIPATMDVPDEQAMEAAMEEIAEAVVSGIMKEGTA